MSRLSPALLLLVGACVVGVRDSDTDDTDTAADSGDTDSADTDTGDTDSGDTGDTGADTADSGDTDDTGTIDTGDTSDSGDTSDTADTDTEDTDTGPLPGLSVEIVAQGLTNPVGVVSPPGDPRLFIIEKRGTIRVVQANGAVSSTFFLDLTGDLDVGFSEQGLLGLAFHPQFATNGLAYAYYTDNSAAVGDNVVAEFHVVGDVADEGSKRILLAVDDPYVNHNGGNLAFGPDGLLYIGLGDGGDAGDPQDRAQDRTTLLGKMLRIDPLGTDTDDGLPAYDIPDDNPYVGVPDVTGIRKEIWSYGLRNPWRWSFDRQTGDLWIGDVGQGIWEEIDFQAASSDGGENWGWHDCEGGHMYPQPPQGPTACALSGSVLPIHEYNQSGAACSVTGGFVYRGSAIPQLQGRYLYADYCAGFVRSFVRSGSTATDHVDHTLDLRDGTASLFGWISSMGQDADGELYLCDHDAGKVWRIVPGP